MWRFLLARETRRRDSHPSAKRLGRIAGRPVIDGSISHLRCSRYPRSSSARRAAAPAVVVLSQTCRVGKRHRGLYLRLVVDTGRGHLTAYLNGRVLKRWPYKLLND